jgi:hypothetical protein
MRSGIIVRGTLLQVEKLQVLLPMRSIGFSVEIMGSAEPVTDIGTRIVLRFKGRPGPNADNLTVIC